MVGHRHRFARVETEELRRLFKQRYEASVRERSRGRIEASVDLGYLARARVTGMFDRGGELLGGWVVNDSAPLLLLSTLPADVRARWLARCPEREQCELVAIWKSAAISQATSGVTMWPRIILDCALARRRRILGLGYDNRMNEIYGVARPTLVHRGPRADKPALNQHVSVYAYTPLSIASTYCVNLVTELMIKPLRRARHSTDVR